jgi:threonine dehydratase
MPDGTLVTLADIREAAERVRGIAVRTPVMPCVWAAGDRSLWLKPENLQPTGAFKIRGAVNAVAALPEAVRARGVVTASSGNHAQAVAYVARRYGVPATVVMPEIAPAVKIEATRELGAEVVLVPPERREAVAAELAERHGRALVPAYDHRDVIAGQGTVGTEIVADLAPDLAPDAASGVVPRTEGLAAVLVPISGGGLISGVAAAVKALRPETRVIGVEPELAGDTAESIRAGRLVRWDEERRYRTIADGLRMQPSELTWRHISAFVDDVVTVSEDEIRSAMRVLALRARLTAEPSGAVTTAAYLHHADSLPARGRVVAVVSGGSVDPALLASVLEAGS